MEEFWLFMEGDDDAVYKFWADGLTAAWDELKEKFKIETPDKIVGYAALPIIGEVKYTLYSREKAEKLEAELSGGREAEDSEAVKFWTNKGNPALAKYRGHCDLKGLDDMRDLIFKLGAIEFIKIATKACEERGIEFKRG